MKSEILNQRLMLLASTERSIDVIKVCELSRIKGGDCPNLQSCGTYNDCPKKYTVRGDISASLTLSGL
jgi:hypothetical protein